MPRSAANTSGRGRFDLQILREDLVPILEFALVTGVLKWDCEKYGRALEMLFPDVYAPNTALERRIAEARRCCSHRQLAGD